MKLRDSDASERDLGNGNILQSNCKLYYVSKNKPC